MVCSMRLFQSLLLVVLVVVGGRGFTCPAGANVYQKCASLNLQR